jgi:hypothetical protein
MRSAIALSVLFALAPACAVLVPAGAGALAVQTSEKDSTYVVQVRVGVELAWASSKTTLSHLCLTPIDTNDGSRTAIAHIDGSKVTVTVEAYDLDQSMIKVAAEKFALGDAPTATMVKDKILADLDRKR